MMHKASSSILAILLLLAAVVGFSRGFTIVENRSNGGLLNAMKHESSESVTSPFKETLSNNHRSGDGTLPSFRAANGLLSPQTVYRMKQTIMRNGGVVDNESIATFLETYERDGPMSCLSMLSDSNVLPHLTKAMRDLA